jgi:Ca2+-binding EF-hand superfamily protein
MCSCLRNVGLTLKSESEIDLADGLTNSKQVIAYDEFIEGIVDKRLQDEVNDILDRIRDVIKESLGRTSSSGRKIKELFSEMDTDDSGTLERREIGSAMAKLGVKLLPEEINVLFERYDYNNSGQLDYGEFLNLVGFQKDGNVSSQARLDDEVDRLLERIQDNLEKYLGSGSSGQSGKALKELFREIDVDGSGTIDKQEFARAMARLGVKLTTEEIATIYERFDADDGRQLKYNDFLKLIGFDASSKSLSDSRQRRGGLDKEIEDLIDKIRSRLTQELGTGRVVGRELKRVFEEIDIDGSNSIDKNELARAMAKLNCKLTRDEADLIFERFDRDNSGKLDYREYLELCGRDKSDRDREDRDRDYSSGGSRSSRLQAEVDKIVDKIQRNMEDELGKDVNKGRELKRVFEQMDTDNSNTVDKKEFARAINKLGVKLTTDEVDAIFERYDADNSRGLEYKEFLTLVGAAAPTRGSSTGGSALQREVDKLIDRIQRQLEDDLGKDVNKGRELKRVFENIDVDGSGTLDKREFLKAMAKLSVKLTTDEVDAIYERYDRNGRGALDYNSFLALAGLDTSAKSQDSRSSRRGLQQEMEDLVDKIRRQLDDSLGRDVNKARELKKAFEQVDIDTTNRVDKRDFQRAMYKLGAKLAADEIDLVFERFEADRSNKLDYREFIELFADNSSRDGRSSQNSRLQREVDDLIDKIQRQLEDELGRDANKGRELKKVFENIDTDGSGTLDKREFAKAMASLRVKLTTDEIDVIYDRYDRNGRGALDYKSFLSLAGLDSGSAGSSSSSSSSQSRSRSDLQREVDDIIDRIQRELENELGRDANKGRELKRVFENIDTDRSGALDKQEFSRAMQRLHVKLTTAEVDTIYERYDQSRRGQLDYSAFLKLVGFN